MSDFKQRLVTEQIDLEDKLNKLDSFLASEKIYSIPQNQRDLLRIQSKAMATYNEILKARLESL